MRFRKRKKKHKPHHRKNHSHWDISYEDKAIVNSLFFLLRLIFSTLKAQIATTSYPCPLISTDMDMRMYYEIEL